MSYMSKPISLESITGTIINGNSSASLKDADIVIRVDRRLE